MSERPTPSGRGPVRGGARSGGARPAGRGAGRRGSDRGIDATAGRPGRYAIGEPHADARDAGPAGTASGPRGEGPVGTTAGGLRGRPSSGGRPPRERGRVSGRAAALGVVLLALVLAYAYPLRVYLAQQAEIARLEKDTHEQRERIRQLAAEVARWNDDEYVKAQARRRLLLVEVGEQIYVVGVDPTTAEEEDDPTPPTWYEQVWTSVQTADDPPEPAEEPSAEQDAAP